MTGTADGGSTVTVLVDGVAAGTTTANSAGVWSFALGTALTDGVRNVTATAADTAGNVSAASAALAVTIDTVAPAAPAGLLLTPASDSGASGDNLTKIAQPIITGTAGAGELVSLYAGATLIGTATGPLSEGANALTATATDTAGNVSGASAALSVTLDTIAPAPASIILAAASDSGALGDGITNIASPVFTGTAEANSTLTLSDGASVLGTLQVDGAGLWSFTPGAALAEGAHPITAVATDAAGNVSLAAPLALTIDTTGPGAPVVLAIALPSDSGAVGDGITNVVSPTLTGTAEANSAVTLSEGATVLGTAQADGAGLWSFTPGAALAQGAHSVTATAADAAGNVSARLRRVRSHHRQRGARRIDGARPCFRQRHRRPGRRHHQRRQAGAHRHRRGEQHRHRV